MSAFSRTSSAKWKERDWWSADLEGEVEKLEVEGVFFLDRRRIRRSRREGGPVSSETDPQKKEVKK